MIQFNQASYLTQVRRLRSLAEDVLCKFPIKPKVVHFIKHGANTIFKVVDHKNKAYVLRIHPPEYHTKEAILEEFKWINHILKKSDISVPRPLLTRKDTYLAEAFHPAISTLRYCDMFEWLPGKKLWKSIDSNYAYEMGLIIAQLQRNGKQVKIKHRHYWDADGLVGENKAKFWNVENLSGISKKDQMLITSARRLTYKRLKTYQDNNPEAVGLIHEDIQPNNLLVHNDKFSVIDFDDCGVGLYGEDLAVALFAFEYVVGSGKSKNFMELKAALFNGYSQYMPLTQKDIEMSPYFLLARKLAVIGWLEARKENPRLRAYFKEAIDRAIKFYKTLVPRLD